MGFEFIDEFLSKLRHLWCYYRRTVGLVRIVGKIFLVIIFRRPEFIERRYLGHDRVVINAFGGDLGDDIFGGFPLFFGMIKNCGAVRCPDVVSLPV